MSFQSPETPGDSVILSLHKYFREALRTQTWSKKPRLVFLTQTLVIDSHKREGPGWDPFLTVQALAILQDGPVYTHPQAKVVFTFLKDCKNNIQHVSLELEILSDPL